jgi:pyruvate dehydrogenase E1 component beta subunit
MRADRRLMMIGQNIAAYSLKQMAEEFGQARIRDTSISESAMVGMAVGAAMMGWKAIVMIAYADISSVAHKAIVQSAAKMHYLTNGRINCPVLIRLPIARFRGHGPMGNEVAVSWFYNVPDLNIVMPASADEAYWGIRDALGRPTPTLFFEDRSIHDRASEISPAGRGGRAAVVRAGDLLTIVAAGRAAALAEDAADELSNRGMGGRLEVVSLGAVKPLDREAVLSSAAKTRRVLIIQDEPPWGGYAPCVRCLLDELPPGRLLMPPRIIAGADQFLPYWDERRFLPSLSEILTSCREMIDKA